MSQGPEPNPFANQPGGPNPYSAPQPPGTRSVTGSSAGDVTGGVIPYKNPPALFAYYLGLFSMAPCLGLLLAIPAIILGILGLRMRARNPAIRGSIHAWFGIVMGSAMIVLQLLGIVALMLFLSQDRKPLEIEMPQEFAYQLEAQQGRLGDRVQDQTRQQTAHELTSAN